MNAEEKRCVNCKISGVPLYPGLDNQLHCADHIGFLLPKKQEEQVKKEGENHVSVSK